jgi:hypothetical protein
LSGKEREKESSQLGWLLYGGIQLCIRPAVSRNYEKGRRGMERLDISTPSGGKSENLKIFHVLDHL